MTKPRFHVEDYMVGWVCALPIELAAATGMLDGGDGDDGHTTNLDTLGRIGKHKVVIACLPAGQMGTKPAAAVATQMQSKFVSIRFGVMVGVGGGIPSSNADIRLGDVVVSQPYMQHGGVVQHDLGKTGPSGFTRTDSPSAPPTILLNALAELQADQLRRRSNPSVYLGNSPKFFDFADSDLPLTKEHLKVLGIVTARQFWEEQFKFIPEIIEDNPVRITQTVDEHRRLPLNRWRKASGSVRMVR
ncbi:MAG: hypothetical protein M1839_004992 [Geoglossum umbratile]|nr:MAG: hypothetical protein M1839_004992 [Geoglossum umbratile]